MKIYYNNKNKIIDLLSALCFLLFALCSILLAICFIFPDRANSGSYLNSAHSGYGVTSGVKRSAALAPNFPSDYPAGLCAHCHEQHASIKGVEPEPAGGAASNYLLFRDIVTAGSVQGQMFCYSCHGTGNLPVQVLGNQWNYSRMATGDTSITCPTTIRDAFRHLTNAGTPQAAWCGSSNGSAHYLINIRTFLTNKWNFGSTTANIDPCSGCHNPHRAQDDPHTSSGRIGGDGKLVSAVSLPSQHSKDNNVWELWGDDSDERMSYYAGALTYQAPYATSNYEPDRSTTTNGLNLVDYVTLCMDCHNSSNIIASTPLGRNLRTINWNTEKHGKGIASDDTFTDVNPPYQDTQCGNYVLACTDCHEPHGAPNPFLARQRVNNGTFSYPGGRGNWRDFCSRCHNQIGHAPGGPHDVGWGCINCHDGGTWKPCTTCHYHGGSYGGNITF